MWTIAGSRERTKSQDMNSDMGYVSVAFCASGIDIHLRKTAYTTFAYSDLSTSTDAPKTPASGVYPDMPLYTAVYTVSATIKNTGRVEGAEVAQLYVTFPGSGQVKQLRGFQKPKLAVGADARVVFQLRRKDLSSWNGQQWVMPKGTFQIAVGSSSKDIRLTGTIVT